MGLFSEDLKVVTTSQEPIEGLPPHAVNANSTIIDTSSDNNTKNSDAALQEFISKAPGATYLIDSSVDANESLLCRAKPEGGQTCLKLGYNYTELFKTMQKFEYFCAAPIHKVETSYFECSKIK